MTAVADRTSQIEELRATVEQLEEEQRQIPLRLEQAKVLDAEEYDELHQAWVEAGGIRTGQRRPDNPRSHERAAAQREQELVREIDLARLALLEAEVGKLVRERSEYRQTTVARRESALDQADAELEAAKERQREARNALTDARLREQKIMTTEFGLRNNANVLRQRHDLPR